MKKTLKLTKFDALLDTDVCNAHTNADLTLTLKMGFRQVNPAGGAAKGTHNDYGSPSGTPRKIIKWTVADWAAWKTGFCRSAQAFWDQKFWLINGAGAFAFKAGSNIFIPNVYCRFALVGSDASAGIHHHVIDVVRLDPSENWFGSHSTLYDSKDTLAVKKGTDSKGRAIMQRAHVHEVGHLLGMGHVDEGKAHCPASGDTNAGACYGVTDTDKNSVMGQGMRLDPKHGAPWLTALAEFVKAESPSSVYTAPAAKVIAATAVMKRHYPRTTAEFEAGKMLTSLLPGR